jgi:hypothetical protein
MKFMLYTLAQAKDPQTLVNLVNGLIQKGYEPHGSLCVIGQPGFVEDICLYVQAMVKMPQGAQVNSSTAGDAD